MENKLPASELSLSQLLGALEIKLDGIARIKRCSEALPSENQLRLTMDLSLSSQTDTTMLDQVRAMAIKIKFTSLTLVYHRSMMQL